MLGDQPGVTEATVPALLVGPQQRAAGRMPLRRRWRAPDRVRAQVFGELAELHGDKGVWRLLDRRADEVERVSLPGPVPLDVDTPRTTRPCSTPWPPHEPRASPTRLRQSQLVPDVETLARRLAAVDYLVDEGLATSMFLSLRLPQPLLLEGEAGVGKTEAARSLAAVLETPLIRLQCYEGIDAAEALYEWNYPRQLLSIRLPTRATRS